MSNNAGFEEFPKIARLSREMIVTEKIDGTNAAVNILTSEEAHSLDVPQGVIVATVSDVDAVILAQSRTRNITVADDNFGWARFVQDNARGLFDVLGFGRHFGEWWGSGIQRRYGLDHKRFSLFNTSRWADAAESGVPGLGCVPTLYNGPFDTAKVDEILESLRTGGSVAAPGFMNPEGVVVYHPQARYFFKKTVEKDEEWKGKSA